MKKIISLLVFFSIIASFPSAFSKEIDPLQRGIREYREENYEEAIEILTEARKESPESSTAAFFLGLAHKQTLNYRQARIHLEAAVTLAPKIKEALVELIDVLQQMGEIEKAKEWIKTAEKEAVSPARVAFLKGMVLQKEGDNRGAVESFEQAKNLDPKLTQTSEFQIGLCYLKEKKLKAARERFQSAVLSDPHSDLAGFARQYSDTLEKRIELEKPLRMTVGVFYQYDDNVVLKPASSDAAAGITGEESAGTVSTVRMDYMPQLPGPWLFNAQYAFYSNAHRHNSTTHDVIGNTIGIAPGYDFGKYAVNLLTSYSHSLVHNRRYRGSLSAGPLVRTLLNRNHILEYFIGYNEKEYFQHIANRLPSEDRDSTSLVTYLSWIWLFKKDAFFNLRSEYINEDTEGRDWENEAFKFIVNAALPLMDTLKLQLNGEAYLENFSHTHSTFNTRRDDNTFTFSIGFNYRILRDADLIAQYTRVRCDSNIAVYDYSQDIYTVGIEYRF